MPKEKKDWFCESFGANFRWLVYANTRPLKDSKLKVPKTKKDWAEAELFTDFGMNPNEFYAVGKNGVELNQEPCKECLKKIKEI